MSISFPKSSVGPYAALRTIESLSNSRFATKVFTKTEIFRGSLLGKPAKKAEPGCKKI